MITTLLMGLCIDCGLLDKKCAVLGEKAIADSPNKLLTTGKNFYLRPWSSVRPRYLGNEISEFEFYLLFKYNTKLMNSNKIQFKVICLQFICQKS